MQSFIALASLASESAGGSKCPPPPPSPSRYKKHLGSLRVNNVCTSSLILNIVYALQESPKFLSLMFGESLKVIRLNLLGKCRRLAILIFVAAN